MAVALDGGFGVGAANQIIPRLIVEIFPRRLDDLMQGFKVVDSEILPEYLRATLGHRIVPGKRL
jgi:hypothetical protein